MPRESRPIEQASAFTKDYGTWEFQMAYALALLEHFSTAQVAEILNVNVRTIQRWKKRAR